MSRTINATLATGLASGTGDPFFRAFIRIGAAYIQVELLNYEIYNLTANITFPYNSAQMESKWFYIQRGLTINSVEYPLNTSIFTSIAITSDLRRTIKVEGHIFDNLKISTAGDVAVNTALDAAMTQTIKAAAAAVYTNTIAWPAIAPWWKTIKFYPAGRTFTTRAQNIESILKGKYLAHLCDQGGNVVKPISSSQFDEDYLFAFTPDETIKVTRTIKRDKSRFFIWRDEAATTHTSGNAINPTHNMGYIESTVDPSPAFGPNSDTLEHAEVFHAMPNLAITNGDPITINNDVTLHILVKETFDPKKTPSWTMNLIPINWVSSTELCYQQRKLDCSCSWNVIILAPFRRRSETPPQQPQARTSRSYLVPRIGGVR